MEAEKEQDFILALHNKFDSTIVAMQTQNNEKDIPVSEMKLKLNDALLGMVKTK
jgi:hypothetical protein